MSALRIRPTYRRALELLSDGTLEADAVVAALFGKTLDGVRRDVAQHLDNVEHERARAAVTQDENAERQDTCT